MRIVIGDRPSVEHDVKKGLKWCHKEARTVKLFRFRLSPPGIRVQLMFWFTSAFAVLLFCSGLLIYKYLESKIEANVDSTLQLQAQQIADNIYQTRGTPQVDENTHALSDMDAKSYRQIARIVITLGTAACILDAQGHPLREAPVFRTLLVPSSSVTQPLRGTPWKGTIRTNDDKLVRLYSRPIQQDGKIVAIIQVARSFDDLHDALADMAKGLLILGTVILCCSAIGSYCLTARAFTPIHRLTQAARTIKAGDLSKRVPVPRTHDEVHFLAVTLNEMIAHIDEMFMRQRRFVADASHELRTPIAAIRSMTDVALLQRDLPQEYATMLHEINEETVRLSNLIKDLLSLARGDEGQGSFEQEVVRLDHLVEMVVEHAEPLAIEQQVALQVQVAKPVTIIGDESRLIQMILNLVDNALLYNHTGGSVTLRVESTRKQAQLTVRDTGKGILPEHLPHIFERFYRGDPAHGRTERGSSGLGLSIVDWIVRAHGGSIAVESQVGRGSTFTVTFPLAPA